MVDQKDMEPLLPVNIQKSGRRWIGCYTSNYFMVIKTKKS